MPNNPGRIDGDYTVGEREEVRYADPPEGFGVVKKSKGIDRRYMVVIGVVVILLIAFILFR